MRECFKFQRISAHFLSSHARLRARAASRRNQSSSAYQGCDLLSGGRVGRARPRCRVSGSWQAAGENSSASNCRNHSHTILSQACHLQEAGVPLARTRSGVQGNVTRTKGHSLHRGGWASQGYAKAPCINDVQQLIAAEMQSSRVWHKFCSPW